MTAVIVLLVAFLVWLFEAIAIITDVWPTITEIVREHRANPWVVIAVCACTGVLTGWAWLHLLWVGR